MKKFISVLVAILMNSMFLNGQTISSSVQNSFSTSTGFIQNQGQINNNVQNCLEVEYYLSAQDMDVFFSKDKISFVFKNSDMQYYRIDQVLYNPTSNLRIIPKEKSDARYNFYTSECPDGITGIRSYKKLIYQNVYENIDLVFYFKGNKLKYDFVVHPYADFKKIQFSYDGYSGIDINKYSINIQSPLGNFTDRLPLIYTKNDSGTNILSGNFKVKNNILGFNIDEYDRSKMLIIDPEIQWSTYLGGSSGDEVRSVTVDTDNNIIVVGNSSSNNYPTTSGAIQTSPRGGYDWTVSKFSSDGNLIWSTLIGSSSRDASFQADLGPDNSIWICGDITSYGFPVTNDAFQKTFGGGTGDAGFAGLSKDGKLLYATYYGGNDYDALQDIGVDSKGNIWLTGRTMSSNFSVTSDAIDKGKGGTYDAVLVKFNSDYQREYATFWGGSHDEFAEGIAIDYEDNIIISGYSYSTDYPASASAYQKNKNDVYDAFIAKFRNDGTPVWSTLFGGNNQDYGSNIATDHENNIILFGYTASTDLDTDNKSFQKNNGGNVDAFCAKFSPDGNFKWSTYVGGSGNEGTTTINDQQGGVATDSYGNIAVCAYTGSKDFPTTADAIQKSNAGALDAFVTVFDKDGKEIWSTYFGGKGNDYAKDVCFDLDNNLIFTGMTSSSDLYTTVNAYQKNLANDNDGFIVRMREKKDTCDETSFVYDDFSDPKNLKLVGQTSHQQNYIRLTPSRINSIGAMWYHRPLPVLNGFTTEFSFRMSDGIAGNDDEASLPGADGIVFVIQNSGNNIIGGDGGRIGYSGLNNSLAIEFDLYANDSKQIVNFNDPNGNHVALMKSVDNIISARHTESNTLAINDSILEIKSDKTEYFAKIDYNIIDKTLRVYLGEDDNYGQPVINYYPIELDQVLNLNEGEWAYMGFTSATGESYQIHDIMSWYVCPQPTESILSVEDDAEIGQLNCFDISGSRQLSFHLESPGNPVIRIFDLLGREVFTDTMHDLPAGKNIYLMPDYLSGVYFYHIIHNDKLINGKILL